MILDPFTGQMVVVSFAGPFFMENYMVTTLYNLSFTASSITTVVVSSTRWESSGSFTWFASAFDLSTGLLLIADFDY